MYVVLLKLKRGVGIYAVHQHFSVIENIVLFTHLHLEFINIERYTLLKRVVPGGACAPATTCGAVHFNSDDLKKSDVTRRSEAVRYGFVCMIDSAGVSYVNLTHQSAPVCFTRT